MEFNVQGIKCDNPTCDYRDMTVKFKDYDKWLNKPCPKCGCNLLTQADYDTVKYMMGLSQSKGIKLVEKVAALAGKKKKYLRLKMNGSGVFKYEEATKEEYEKELKGG